MKKIIPIILVVVLCLSLSCVAFAADGHSHTWTSGEYVQPTCTEEGFRWYHCECGYNRRNDFSKPLGHNLVSSTITKVPTALTEGVKSFTCYRCGASGFNPEILPIDPSYGLFPSLIVVIGDVLTASLGWVKQTVQVVVDNPVLFIGIAISFIGFGVIIFKRIRRV